MRPGTLIKGTRLPARVQLGRLLWSPSHSYATELFRLSHVHTCTSANTLIDTHSHFLLLLLLLLLFPRARLHCHQGGLLEKRFGWCLGISRVTTTRQGLHQICKPGNPVWCSCLCFFSLHSSPEATVHNSDAIRTSPSRITSGPFRCNNSLSTLTLSICFLSARATQLRRAPEHTLTPRSENIQACRDRRQHYRHHH